MRVGGWPMLCCCLFSMMGAILSGRNAMHIFVCLMTKSMSADVNVTTELVVVALLSYSRIDG